MREPAVPSLEELLLELERTSPPSSGRTIKEWAREWGVSAQRVRDLIDLAIGSGRMTIQNANRPNIRQPGRRVSVWLYSFKAKTKAKAAKR